MPCHGTLIFLEKKIPLKKQEKKTWGDITCIKNQLQNMEIKALKKILRVKCGTTNDIVLYELNRCSIIAKIKDRQYSFYKKILELPPGEAVISDIITLCQRSKFLRYYADLKSDNCIADKHQREKRINESENSMCVCIIIILIFETKAAYIHRS